MEVPPPLTPAEVALGRAAIARGLLSAEALRAAVAGRRPGEPLAAALVARGLIAARQLEALEASPVVGDDAPTRADGGAPAARGRLAPGGPAPARAPSAADAPDPDATRPPPPSTSSLGSTDLDAVTLPAPAGERAASTAFDPDAARLPGLDAGQPRRAGALPPGYAPLGELGRGGMGVVHRAREEASGREVAVKLILSELADPTAVARFVREGQVTAALRHPNVVAVHAAGEHAGSPYLVYELVEGARPLAAVLPGLDLRARVAYVRDAARALGVAHRAGVVHRDVKPANLLVDAGGALKVSDFGLAGGAALDRLTRTGAPLGTPAFMAPEQLDGDRAAQGPPTDVWALGVVLYEALTGERPFRGSTFPELAAQVFQRAPRPPRALDAAIPPDLEAVCLRCLAQAPADRYPHGEALARDLERWLAGEQVQGGLRPARPGVRLALAAALALGGAAGLVAWRARPSGAADLAALRDAIAAARRVGGGTSLDALAAEAAAIRAVDGAAGRVAAPRQGPARELVAESGLEPRRRAVLALLVRRALEGPATAPAAADPGVLAARELAALDGAPGRRLDLARALARTPDGRLEAVELARGLARDEGLEPGARGEAARLLLALHRPAEAAAALAAAPPALADDRGRALLAAGDLDGAAVQLAAAAAAAPEEPEVALDLAALALARGEASAALAALDRSRHLGRLARWHGLRAEALAALDRPAEARGHDAQAQALDPAGPWRLAAARRALARGRTRTALAALARSDEPAARLDAAFLAWATGGDDEPMLAAAARAREDARAARAPRALEARARAATAWVALARGDVGEAREEVAAGLALDPAAGDLAALDAALAGGAHQVAVAEARGGAARASAPRAPWPIPAPSVGVAVTPRALAGALRAEARRLVAAALVARQPGALARLARLAARACALDPEDVEAAVWGARAAGGSAPAAALPALAAAIAARPDAPLPRRARVAWCLAWGLEPALVEADLETLAARGQATPDDLLALAERALGGGRLEDAWAALRAVERRDLIDRPAGLTLARGLLARRGRDAARLQGALEDAAEGYARLQGSHPRRLDDLYEALQGLDAAGAAALLARLPRVDALHAWSAHAHAVRRQDLVESSRSLAAYLLAPGVKCAARVLEPRHLGELGAALRSERLEELDAAVAAAPQDPARRLASAAARLLFARSTPRDDDRARQAGRDVVAAEQVEQAADLALAGAVLAPLQAGAAAFAADLLVEAGALEDAGELLEAAETLGRVARSDPARLAALDLGPRGVPSLEPERAHDGLVGFARVRLAVARGELEAACEVMSRLAPKEEVTGRTGYDLARDPVLGPHAQALERALARGAERR